MKKQGRELLGETKTQIDDITLEKAKQMELIPLDNIFYRNNRENGSSEFFIMSSDQTKLKTYSNFINHEKKYEKFKIVTGWAGKKHCEIKIKNGYERLNGVYGLTENMKSYRIKDFDKVKSPLFTTTADLDNFIELTQKEFDNEIAEENEKKQMKASLEDFGNDLLKDF